MERNPSKNMAISGKVVSCPLCDSPESETLIALDCGNIDGSPLYPTVRVELCAACGHAFNEISQEDAAGLEAYYNNQYAPANLNSRSTGGDLPGSASPLTVARYTQIHRMLESYMRPDDEVLDIGCALGGFLRFLHDKGYGRLSGLEKTKAYAEQARAGTGVRVEEGNAEALPFDSGVFDVVVLEQVLEHLVNPSTAFREARRVLRKGGLLFVGVPDASRYGQYPFFDFYWLLLREHIQHFDAEHLRILAEREGFEMMELRQGAHAVMSESMIMPNLCALFSTEPSHPGRPCKPLSHQQLRRQLGDYVTEEARRTRTKASQIEELAISGRPVYVWGIGREFLYLYESTGLKACNLWGLIDVNPYKQMKETVGGMAIGSPEYLQQANGDSVLLVTAMAHVQLIEETLRKMGFPGEVITLDDKRLVPSKVSRYET